MFAWIRRLFRKTPIAPRKEPVNIIRTIEHSERDAAPILTADENASTPAENPALGKLGHLPPFSPVAISLIRQFDREDVDVREIVSLVRSDVTLAAETLAYVNSPLFALREPISDLHHAITVLGLANTKSLATTLAMRSMLKSAPKNAVVRRLWRHSLATSVIATELAPIYGIAPDLANTSGVLHDVGRLGLLSGFSEEYSHLILSLYDNVEAVLAAERETCGMDHCEAGAYLSKVWELPEVFREVIGKHHLAGEQSGILGLGHFACSLADDLGFSAISHRGLLPLSERVETCVPEALRDRVKSRCAEAETQILQKVQILDF